MNIRVLLCFIPFSLSAVYDSWRAERAFHDKDFKRAEQLYRQETAAFPDDIKSSYNVGKTLYEQKKYELARELFTTVAEKSAYAGEQEQALFNAGDCLMQQREFKEALKTYERVLSINSANKHARERIELARKLEQQKQEQKTEQEKKDKEKKQDDKNKDKKDTQDKGQEQQNSEQQSADDQQEKKGNNAQKGNQKREQGQTEQADQRTGDKRTGAQCTGDQRVGEKKLTGKQEAILAQAEHDDEQKTKGLIRAAVQAGGARSQVNNVQKDW